MFETKAKILFTMKIDKQAVSMKNSRRLVWVKRKMANRPIDTKAKRPLYIKSPESLEFEKSFVKAAKKEMKREVYKDTEFPIICDVVLHADLWYASNRRDLDESQVMDCLQKAGVIKNDRQIKEKHIYHYINRLAPNISFFLEVKI